MQINGEAIYGHSADGSVSPGSFAFTHRGSTLYAIYLPERMPLARCPQYSRLPARQGSKVFLLGSAKKLAWSKSPVATPGWISRTHWLSLLRATRVRVQASAR